MSGTTVYTHQSNLRPHGARVTVRGTVARLHFRVLAGSPEVVHSGPTSLGERIVAPVHARRIRFVASLTLAAALGVAVDHFAFAQQPAAQNPAIKRTLLDSSVIDHAKEYRAIMGISEIAPGGSSGKHRHPGFELAYVLEGTVSVMAEGKATPTVYKAGDHMSNHGVHNATNTGKAPAKILAVYVIEKGQPIAVPVP